MLLRNDLLQYAPPRARTVRILWIAPEQDHAYVFDVGAKTAEVERVRMAVLTDDIRSGRACVLAADPYLVVLSQELLPPKHLQLRARAWEIVEALTLMEPDIYEARLRGPLVARVTEQHGVSHPTVYRYLRRYWQRGQTPNALLPDYGNSGGRGKVRAASAGVKRGRPRKNGSGLGLNADEDIRRVFRVATAHYAAAHGKFSRLGAFQQMLADFFCVRRIDPHTGRVQLAPNEPPPALPTYGQFSYWLDQDDDRPASVLRRAGDSTVRRQVRATRAGADAGQAHPGDVAAPPPHTLESLPSGRPGSGFYLDAVRAEVQLVSRADRRQAIGRPLVYLAVDSFSRMVTGVYVGMGAPSWQQAMLALANCGADKQRHCRQFGTEIEAEQWPCRHLPETLFVNAGLEGGWSGDALLNNFNLRCMAAEHGPSEWKAVLEKRFRLLAPHEDGRGSRLDGVLDLEQFTRIVLDAVLYYNNRHALSCADGATPRQLWDWGMAHRGGGLKIYPEHLVRCTLLPATQAVVTADGIRLHDTYYTCARAINERWFERARQRGQWEVRIAFDTANLDMVYLLDPVAAMQFHTCHMTERSSARRHLSAVEIAFLQRGLERQSLLAGDAEPRHPAAHAVPSFAG